MSIKTLDNNIVCHLLLNFLSGKAKMGTSNKIFTNMWNIWKSSSFWKTYYFKQSKFMYNYCQRYFEENEFCLVSKAMEPISVWLPLRAYNRCLNLKQLVQRGLLLCFVVTVKLVIKVHAMAKTWSWKYLYWSWFSIGNNFTRYILR